MKTTILMAFFGVLSTLLTPLGRAQVEAFQVITVDIPATLNQGGGAGIVGELYTALANTINGTAPVLSATPRFQVNIDPGGNHGLSALSGSFQSVTITRSGRTLSVSGEPLGVGLALEYESLPDFVSYEVKIENERVILEVVQRKNGIEKRFSREVVQIFRKIQPLYEHPDWGLIQAGYLRVLNSRYLRAHVTLGPIEVVDDDDHSDEGEDSTH